MLKKIISIFFSLALLIMVVAPAVTIILDDILEISLVLDIGEEESNEKESKTLEFNVSTSLYSEESDKNLSPYLANEHYLLSNSQLHAESVSPPPERYI